VFLPTQAVLVQWYSTVLVEDLAAHTRLMFLVHGLQNIVPYLCKGYPYSLFERWLVIWCYRISMQHEAPGLPLIPDRTVIPMSTYITPRYPAFGDLKLGTKNWKVQLWPNRLRFDPFYFKA